MILNTSGKRVLVTGGAGFIGSAIVNDLLRNGYQVYVIDNLSFGNRKFISGVPEEHFFNVDLLHKTSLADVIKSISPEIVIHLAAIHFIPYCNQHSFQSSNINICGTANLLDAIEECPATRFLFFASTAAVYPVAEGAMNEEIPPGPSDIYGLSKFAGERLSKEFFLRTGVPTVIGRFFNAFGPNETNPHLVPSILSQIMSGSRTLQLGNLEPKRDYIHTSDVADAVRMLMEQHNSGIEIFNIGSGEEFSVREIVKAFEDCLPYQLEIIQDQQQIRKSDRMHLLSDISKIRGFLKWQPKVSVSAGLRMLVNDNLSINV